MHLDTVACMLAENDLLLRSVLPLTNRTTWEVVHALRFRGWICDNLNLELPSAVSERLATINTDTFTSPLYAQPVDAVNDLLAISGVVATAATMPSSIDWSISRPYFKPNHRHLAAWILFMLAHDAWHLGRASLLTRS